jgi:hypothetical protein
LGRRIYDVALVRAQTNASNGGEKQREDKSAVYMTCPIPSFRNTLESQSSP